MLALKCCSAFELALFVFGSVGFGGTAVSPPTPTREFRHVYKGKVNGTNHSCFYVFVFSVIRKVLSVFRSFSIIRAVDCLKVFQTSLLRQD
jgi:hypothetical protein